MKVFPENPGQCWVDFYNEEAPFFIEKINNGMAGQSTYTTLASATVTLAHGQCLLGYMAEARASYLEAAKLTATSFKMAYDSASPEYIGDTDLVDWSDVDEVCCLEMMNWALIAHDFDYAEELARWVQPSPDNDPMPEDVGNYVYALRDTLLGDWQVAEDRISQTFKKYAGDPPFDESYRHNYYSLSLALAGIIRRDDVLFNQGLQQQLLFYRSYAEGEAEDTDEQYICDNALALAVLAKQSGRTLTLVDEDYLPLDLINP